MYACVSGEVCVCERGGGVVCACVWQPYFQDYPKILLFTITH